MTYFTAKSNLVTLAFLWEKVKTMDFSESIAACDLKDDTCRQLIELMKVSEVNVIFYLYPRSLIFVN